MENTRISLFILSGLSEDRVNEFLEKHDVIDIQAITFVESGGEVVPAGGGKRVQAPRGAVVSPAPGRLGSEPFPFFNGLITSLAIRASPCAS